MLANQIQVLKYGLNSYSSKAWSSILCQANYFLPNVYQICRAI